MLEHSLNKHHGEGLVFDLSIGQFVFAGLSSSGRPHGRASIPHDNRVFQEVVYRHGNLVEKRTKPGKLDCRCICIPSFFKFRPRKTPEIFLSHSQRKHADAASATHAAVLESGLGFDAILDVLNLDRISDLEKLVNSISVVVVFHSHEYFKSKKCLVELVTAFRCCKPVVPVVTRDAPFNFGVYKNDTLDVTKLFSLMFTQLPAGVRTQSLFHVHGRVRGKVVPWLVFRGVNTHHGPGGVRILITTEEGVVALNCHEASEIVEKLVLPRFPRTAGQL